jgi:uncharacterized RDD family membrane protein YckC
MSPIIGVLVWILAGVFGVGAAVLAFYSSYRRENPRRPKKPTEPPPAPPAPPVVPPDAIDVAGVETGDADREQPAAAVAVDIPPPLSVPVRATTPLAFPRASFVERLAALVLDAIAVVIIAQLLSLDRSGDFGDRLMVFFALVYHVGFWTWKGTTPGGMICQLRVARLDGKPLEFAEALVRGLTGIFSLAVAGLGFFWMLWDPEGQTWHDRVAGTYVVKVPRSVPA